MSRRCGGIVGLIGLVIVSCVGCSLVAKSLMSSKAQMVSINSQPSEAVVTINGTPRGHTPLSVPLPISGEYVVQVEKTGYVPYVRSVRASGGLDGSERRLDASNMDIVLQPLAQGRR